MVKRFFPSLIVARKPPPFLVKRSVTINHLKVPSDQSSFPVLITGTLSYLATKANGGDIYNTTTQTGGGASITVPADLKFTSDSAGVNLLSWEFETYNSSTGAVNIWVKSDITSASDKVFYMWYSNPGQSLWIGDVNGVWSNSYSGVWHLPDGTTLGDGTNIYDSSATAATGVLSGSTKPSAVAGKVDGGANFNGTTAYTDHGNVLDFTTGDMTIEGWFKTTATSGYLIDKFNGTGGGYAMYLNTLGGGGSGITIYVQTDGSNWKQIYDNSALHKNDGVWHHFVATRSSTTTLALYTDGVTPGTITQSSGTVGSVSNSVSLQMSNASIPSYYNGSLDEIRISTVARTLDYATACFNNQGDPSNFVTISSPL